MKSLLTLLLLLAMTTGYGQTSQTSAGAKLKKSVQCTATTKNGTQCKHMTYNANGLCKQHEKVN